MKAEQPCGRSRTEGRASACDGQRHEAGSTFDNGTCLGYRCTDDVIGPLQVRLLSPWRFSAPGARARLRWRLSDASLKPSARPGREVALLPPRSEELGPCRCTSIRPPSSIPAK